MEISAFIGLDVSLILTAKKLFIPTKHGIRGPVPIGAYIIKDDNGQFEIA